MGVDGVGMNASKKSFYDAEIDAFRCKYILIGAITLVLLLQGSAMASLIGPGMSRSINEKYYYDNIHEEFIESLSFGSKVIEGETDIGKMIYDFTASPVFAYWDVGLTGGKFDSQDVAYLHLNDGILTVNPGDIRLTGYSHHPAGSRVGAEDIDTNKNLTAFPNDWKLVFVDQTLGDGYDLADPVYIHLNGTSSKIERFDIRISDSTYGKAGTLVDGNSPDRGIPFIDLIYHVRFYNLNGNMKSDGTPVCNGMDPVYLDFSHQ